MLFSRSETHEIQQVSTIGGSPTPITGTFTLTFRGETTADIPYDASEYEFKAALDALNTIGAVDGVGSVEVHREGPIGNGMYTWMVTFRGTPGNLPALTWNEANLLGTGANVTVTKTHNGKSNTFSGGLNPRIVTEQRLPGLPSYTGRYIPTSVGAYALAVRQLTAGGLTGDYFDNQVSLASP
jgi:hypothetical protein